MKVLVTGGTSVLVKVACQQLLQRGDSVVVLQRGESNLQAECVRGDIRDESVVRRAARGCDVIIHAAAKVGVVGSWDEFRSINVDGTNNVVAAAQFHGIARLVHVSTPSVAHAGHGLVGASASAPITGRSHAWYAESKALAENLALAASSTTLGVVAIRPHLVWGPGDTQLVGRIVQRARAGRLALVGGGSALMDSTYVDNAAAALVAAADVIHPAAACAGRAYVVANGEPRPVRELVMGIVGAAGLDVRPRCIPRRIGLIAGSAVERAWVAGRRRGEPPITRFIAEQLSTAHWFDPRPALADLHWAPEVSLAEGLRRLQSWFRIAAPLNWPDSTD